MALFADACAIISFYGDEARGMSPPAVTALSHAEVLVSAITVWEISRKIRIGKLPSLPAEIENDLSGYLRREGFRLVPLTPEVAEAANALPPHHADPMDRMLIAAAQAEGAGVITLDRVFAAYGVAVLW